MVEPFLDKNGNKKWWNEKGQFHRENGPAVEYYNGDKYWHLNGELHREAGPAIECVNGDKRWYLNGKLHREDGPAVEWFNGDKCWYLDGKELSEAEFLKKSFEMKSTMTVNQYGTKEWKNEKGQFHREDGPAIEYSNGDKAWYLNGQLHREDGPAIECSNGTKWWYLNGQCHREGGPAVEYANGNKSWYFNGQSHREDGPAKEYINGDKVWYLNDKPISEADFLQNIKKSINSFPSKTNDVKFLLGCFALGSILNCVPGQKISTKKSIRSYQNRDGKSRV